VEPGQGDGKSQVPGPSLLPVAFAIGLVIVLVGLIISNWIAVGIGAVIAFAFGGVWIRDLSARSAEGELEPPPPPTRVVGAEVSPATTAVIAEGERYPRDRFLEGATLGLGALIGAVVTIPPLGLLAASGFEGSSFHDVNLGALSEFPEGKFIITTFVENPEAGEVSRRTAYIRNNGFLGELPSFTILSNHCAHLGCPVQPNGPVDTNQKKEVKDKQGNVVLSLTPVQPAGFGCPCHGGQYDTEGNRTAGPPVRALDRYTYSIVGGHLILGSAFSVAKVEGTGKDAKIKKTRLQFPGQHVDGPEFWLWPIPEIRT
jgi:menaquinol-cytochrome c reductase iron-sulfur subunit